MKRFALILHNRNSDSIQLRKNSTMNKVELDKSGIVTRIRAESVFHDMEQTRENSPYHREANVLVHTMMTCAWYSHHACIEDDWYSLGYLACLLHDVGKPCCRTQKHNEKRGTYYSYDRHDVVGARMAEEILVTAKVHDFDVYRIVWMIRNHQIFWSTKKSDLRSEMSKVLVDRDFYLAFKLFMQADDFGRISDSRSVDSIEFFRSFEIEQKIKLG